MTRYLLQSVTRMLAEQVLAGRSRARMALWRAYVHWLYDPEVAREILNEDMPDITT